MKFTAETAVDFALKSVEARKEKAKIARLRPPARKEPDFAELVLARVRAQMDLINLRLTQQLERKRIDPQAIDRLAAAQSRLSEQERILAGRPMPGSLKPTADKPRRQNHDFTPQPVASSVPHPDTNTPPSTPPVQ